MSTNEELLTFEMVETECIYERDVLLELIPEEQFFDYVLVPCTGTFYKEYRVHCSYREKSLFSYNIRSAKDLGNINVWIPSIHECLCRIICFTAYKGEITLKEEQFIIDTMNDYNFQHLHGNILRSYRDFSPRLQQQLRVFM